MSDDYSRFQEQSPRLWAATNRLWGTGERGMSMLFGREDGTAPTVGVPFPRQARMSNRLAYFDQGSIADALRDKDRHFADIDPRTLMAGQPSITRAGVDYYMGDEYRRTGRTYADQHSGNIPLVYEATHPHFGWTERSIHGGHHRATAALLRGEPFRAVLVRAPYLR